MSRVSHAFAALAVVLIAADEPARKYQVVSPKDDGIIGMAINGRGDIVGFEWVDDKKAAGVINQDPFFAVGKRLVWLPRLEGFTATFPTGISDNGLVVGRVSKPFRADLRIRLQNQAFVWDEKTGIHGLGVLADDLSSFASAVTRDGRRISGFSVGENRVRPCVWDRDGIAWKISALPIVGKLSSQAVAMSDDGKRLAAVDGSDPCLWTQADSGEWKRETIGDAGSLVPRSVNRSGMVVGVRHTGDGLTHAVIWNRDTGMKVLEKPKGYVRSEALGVNNAGIVVGLIDGLHGTEFGPRGFVYENGRLRIITEGGPNFAGASAINDNGQITGTMEADDEGKKSEPAAKPSLE